MSISRPKLEMMETLRDDFDPLSVWKWTNNGAADGKLPVNPARGATSLTCLDCDATITVQPGEVVTQDDPRLCAHMRETVVVLG